MNKALLKEVLILLEQTFKEETLIKNIFDIEFAIESNKDIFTAFEEIKKSLLRTRKEINFDRQRELIKELQEYNLTHNDILSNIVKHEFSMNKTIISTIRKVLNLEEIELSPKESHEIYYIECRFRYNSCFYDNEQCLFMLSKDIHELILRMKDSDYARICLENTLENHKSFEKLEKDIVLMSEIHEKLNKSSDAKSFLLSITAQNEISDDLINFYFLTKDLYDKDKKKITLKAFELIKKIQAI